MNMERSEPVLLKIDRLTPSSSLHPSHIPTVLCSLHPGRRFRFYYNTTVMFIKQRFRTAAVIIKPFLCSPRDSVLRRQIYIAHHIQLRRTRRRSHERRDSEGKSNAPRFHTRHCWSLNVTGCLLVYFMCTTWIVYFMHLEVAWCFLNPSNWITGKLFGGALSSFSDHSCRIRLYVSVALDGSFRAVPRTRVRKGNQRDSCQSGGSFRFVWPTRTFTHNFTKRWIK